MNTPVRRTAVFRLSLCLALIAIVGMNARSARLPTAEVGIAFFKGSWKEVLAEAKRQNKPVFVDIYTTWCGPCKLMAKQAFPDAKVGETFNARFINYQIDAEKGEGIDVAKKYAVTAYPTSLYVSANGDLIHRAIGYGGIKGMLDEADKAVAASSDPNPLSVLEKQYEGGKRNVDFLADYLQKRAKVGMPNGAALEAYLNIVPEDQWSSDKNMAIMAGNITSASSKGFDFLNSRLSAIRMTPAGRETMMSLQRAMQNDFKQAVEQKDESQLDQFIKRNGQMMSALRPEQQKQMASDYRMRFYQQTKNIDKYRALAQVEGSRLMAMSVDSARAKNEMAYRKFMTQTAMMPDSIKNGDNFKKASEQMKTAETMQMAMKLNGLAWAYHQTMTDNEDLNQALNWSARSLEYDRSAAGMDTNAHLLSKLGRKEEAIKMQEEAIAKLKAAGQDTADYEKSLAEIKQK